MSRESENSTGKISHIPIKNRIKVIHGAVDPHSFFADPDPAVLLNADSFLKFVLPGSGSGFRRETECGFIRIRLHSPGDPDPQHLLYCTYVSGGYFSATFELVVLAEEVEGEEGLDLEDHLLLVGQGVVADGVGHHHGQLKLHPPATRNYLT